MQLLRNLFFSCCLAFSLFLCSCGKNNGQSLIKDKSYSSAISSLMINETLDPRNDMSDLITEQNFVIGVKDKQNFESIILNNEITGIKEEAFSCCTELDWIIIPGSVEVIEESAFYKCTSLKWIVIDNNYVEIENDAFLDCFQLQTIYFKSGNNKFSDIYDLDRDDVQIIEYEDYQELNLIGS